MNAKSPCLDAIFPGAEDVWISRTTTIGSRWRVQVKYPDRDWLVATGNTVADAICAIDHCAKCGALIAAGVCIQCSEGRDAA